ncbi:hypothetical protein HG535_0B00360 [Zygotorulaspora mrakii]|uniref:Uncharacterized protein n=1 Tax=Zygotorulaspora mrakii TaxID=42260 RepID=A0A7H9AX57_ZYGMR|nr:uncharacterized protein HG535_0B00360 [Zygotorulaspora mrakii]QLG70998.1 hypothetical protein HG535_0B00360 [Zygotorulaspora mrakii]
MDAEESTGFSDFSGRFPFGCCLREKWKPRTEQAGCRDSNGAIWIGAGPRSAHGRRKREIKKRGLPQQDWNILESWDGEKAEVCNSPDLRPHGRPGCRTSRSSTSAVSGHPRFSDILSIFTCRTAEPQLSKTVTARGIVFSRSQGFGKSHVERCRVK